MIKRILGLAALALVLGLVLSPDAVERRISRIRNGFERGILPVPISDDVTNRFRHLAQAAGYTDDLRVNLPPTADGLTVIVCSSAAGSITSCGQGNAVYEEAIDTIFIDQDVLFPSRATGSFGSMRIGDSLTSDPASTVYRELVFLHELGHRQLHRGTSGRFDARQWRDNAAARERKADEFAVTHLLNSGENYGRAGINTGHRFSQAIARRSGGEESPLFALADMSLELTRSLLFADTPFSSYGIDTGYPSFADRCASMIDAALPLADSRDARVFLQIASRYLGAVAALRHRIVADINVGTPIIRAAIVDARLIIIGEGESSDTWRVVEHPVVEVTSADSSALNLSLAPSRDDISPGWISSGAIIQDVRGQLHIATGGQGVVPLQPDAPAMSFEFPAERDFDEWESVAASSSGEWLLTTTRAGDGLIHDLYHLGSLMDSRSHDEINGRLEELGVPSYLSWWPRFEGEELYSASHASNYGGAHVAYLASMSPSTLQVESVATCAIPATLRVGGARGLNDVAPSALGAGMLFSADTLDAYAPKDRAYVLTVFAPDKDGLREIARTSLVLDAVPDGDTLRAWLTFQHPSMLWSAPVRDGRLFTVPLDGLYLYNESRSELALFFYPPEVHVSTNGDDIVVLYAPGGSRCLVVDLMRDS